MLFSNNRKNIAALVAVAIVLAAPVGLAREDGGGGPVRTYARPLTPLIVPQAPRFRFELRDIEPAAGGRLVVASTPRLIETPEPAPAPLPVGKRLGAFASFAISAGQLPFAKKWRGVTGADYTALFTGDCAGAGLAGCDSRLAIRLRRARSAAAGQSARAALETVNATVNAALVYGADRANWGQGDSWATPAETLSRGVGDCEEFAITKLWLLRSLGFDPGQLQLVVLQDTRKGVYHAVLAVHLDGERLILDNLAARVRPDSAFPSYLPIMSFVGDKSYIHGFEAQRSDFAQMPKDLASVSPGEGV